MSLASANAIRPMALAPRIENGGGPSGSSTAPALFLAGSSNGSSSGQMMIHPDSGGGPTPTPTAPVVRYSGGSSITGNGSGTFSIPGGVPVGDRITFNIDGTGGLTVDPDTIRWSGDSGYSSYFSDPYTTTVAANPGLQNVKPGTNVPNNQQTYTFIVTPNANQYSIVLNLAYLDPNDGEDIVAPPTTVTFNAVSPTTATLVATNGYWVSYTLGGYQIVGYSDNNHPWNSGSAQSGLGQGIIFTASTQADANFGGNFMIMQTGSFYYGQTDNNNVSTHLSNSGGGPNLDDGLFKSHLQIGMTGWPLAAGASSTNSANDPPLLCRKPLARS